MATEKYFKIVRTKKELYSGGYKEVITILFENMGRGLIDITGDVGSYKGEKYSIWYVHGPGFNATTSKRYSSKSQAISAAKAVYMR